MTATDLDTTAVTDELLDEEVACDIVADEECAYPARWRAVATHVDGSRCGWDPSCDQHRAMILEAERLNPGKHWSCVEHIRPVNFTWERL